MAEAARRLGCSTGVIYHWIHTGQLTARRGSGSRFCIPWDAQAGRCQDRPVRPPGPGRPPPHTPGTRVPRRRRRRGQRHRSRLPARLQHRVIYYWIETGQLTARRGAGNRLHIPWNDQIQAECRSRIGQSGHLNPAARRTKPRGGAEQPECRCHLPCSHHQRGPDQHRSAPIQNIPTRGCRRGSMNRPSRPWPTGWSRPPEAGAGTDLRGGFPAVLVTGSARAAARRTRSPRSTCIASRPGLRVGARGRHRGMLRRDRALRP